MMKRLTTQLCLVLAWLCLGGNSGEAQSRVGPPTGTDANLDNALSTPNATPGAGPNSKTQAPNLLPVQSYTVLDLGLAGPQEYLNRGVVALDDEGKAAFGNLRRFGDATVQTFQNGVVSPVRTCPWVLSNGPAPYSETLSWDRLLPSGTIVGSHVIDYNVEYGCTLPPGGAPIDVGIPPPFLADDDPHGYNLPSYIDYATRIMTTSPNGTNMIYQFNYNGITKPDGSIYRLVAYPASYYCDVYATEAVLRRQGVGYIVDPRLPSFLSDSATLKYLPYAAGFSEVTNNGWALGYQSVWDGQHLFTAGLGGNDLPHQLNEQGWCLLGASYTKPGGNSLWHDSKTTSLASLLVGTPWEHQIQQPFAKYLSSQNATDKRMYMVGTVTDDGRADELVTWVGTPVPASPGNAGAYTWQPWRMQLPTGMHLTLDDLWHVNSSGVIAAIGNAGTGDDHALLLVPVSLIDTKDQILDTEAPAGTVINEHNQDVIIVPQKDENDTNIHSVAWIEPHGADDGSQGPDMPQLMLRIRGVERMGLSIQWSLKVEYKRPNGRNLAEDTVFLQSGGQNGLLEPFDGHLRIYNNSGWKAAVGQQTDELQPNRGFFGGNAKLIWQLFKSDGVALLPPQTILFRIAGKNPDDALCRHYIDAGAANLLAKSETLMWFAYAIAKSETEDEGGEKYYNQFLKQGSKKGPKPGSEGVPNWNYDGKGKPGGFGIKQVTGYKGNELGDIPRSVIWNWEHNVDEGLRELTKINLEAHAWMRRQRVKAAKPLPPHQVLTVHFSDGTPHVMEDAVAIKRYNGASLNGAPDSYNDLAGGFTFKNEIPHPPKGIGHYCYWDESRGKWSLCRYNSLQPPFVYLSRVCQEVDP